MNERRRLNTSTHSWYNSASENASYANWAIWWHYEIIEEKKEETCEIDIWEKQLERTCNNMIASSKAVEGIWICSCVRSWKGE